MRAEGQTRLQREEKRNEGKVAEFRATRADFQPSLSSNISLIFAPFKKISSSAQIRELGKDFLFRNFVEKTIEKTLSLAIKSLHHQPWNIGDEACDSISGISTTS